MLLYSIIISLPVVVSDPPIVDTRACEVLSPKPAFVRGGRASRHLKYLTLELDIPAFEEVGIRPDETLINAVPPSSTVSQAACAGNGRQSLHR
jgi:hypothetical protein